MGTGTTEREVNHEPVFDLFSSLDTECNKSLCDKMFEAANYKK